VNRDSGEDAISADGRYVAFTSDANKLVAWDTKDTSDVFVHDRQDHTRQRQFGGRAGERSKQFPCDQRLRALRGLYSGLVFVNICDRTLSYFMRIP